MAHESFENDEVAEILNRDYISIKVDREERPDVDHLYMSVCQAMTGHGGWPLTIVMTPDKKPFFAGTYFPTRNRHGRYGLMELLGQITQKWRDDPDQVMGISDQAIDEIQKRMSSDSSGGTVSAHNLDQAYEMYAKQYDKHYGGFGAAPKFPSAHNLSFLLRYYNRTNQVHALEMVEKTLDAMYRGGMYDHIGYGFARYSTDEKWLVPHFEKMLYDNALLAITYIEAFQVTRNQKYAEIAEQIFTYVLRDMTSPEGAFFSAEDADSEGVEGKFYVWTVDEILEVLGGEEGVLFCQVYDITYEGNFEGMNIPNLIDTSLQEIADQHGISIDTLNQRLNSSRQKLFTHRDERIHPHKDDKILTAWNGLMIAALAKAGKALNNDRYTVAAKHAAQFILTKLRRPEDGRLLARYRDGEAKFLGYVDDYAFMVWGLMELYEACFEFDYLQTAIQLNEDMLRLFWDDEAGGLFFYGSDGENLFTRPKETYDGAMPSGNSVAALNFLRLSKLTYNASLAQKSDEQIALFAGALNSYAAGHGMFLIALELASSPGSEIVIVGNQASNATSEMITAARIGFRPNTLQIYVPEGAEGDRVRKKIPLVQDKLAIGGKTTAYVCENFACQAPTTDVQELVELLNPE